MMYMLNDLTDAGFRARVDFAARAIAAGHSPTRNFDNCFENNDGDAVVVALIGRSRDNPNGRLAANLMRYISTSSLRLGDRHADLLSLKGSARLDALVAFAADCRSGKFWRGNEDRRAKPVFAEDGWPMSGSTGA